MSRLPDSPRNKGRLRFIRPPGDLQVAPNAYRRGKVLRCFNTEEYAEEDAVSRLGLFVI